MRRYTRYDQGGSLCRGVSIAIWTIGYPASLSQIESGSRDVENWTTLGGMTEAHVFRHDAMMEEGGDALLAASRRTVSDIAILAGMPDRLAVELLINLMRASWVEVRSTDLGGTTSACRMRS